MKGEHPPVSAAIAAWWDAVLAGRVDEPHPVHSDDLKVTIKKGVLRLSGTIGSEEDRQELLTSAQRYVGHGIDKVEADHLKLVERKEKPGVLEQTLVAAFPNRDVAELARKYLVDLRRLRPKQTEILGPGDESKARRLLPEDFAREVDAVLKSGDAVLVVRVDETDMFKARELLAEDTRSTRTVSTPPVPVTSAADG